MLNALNGCDGIENQRNDMIKSAAGLFPDDEIGGIKCSDLSSKPIQIVEGENGVRSLRLLQE